MSLRVIYRKKYEGAFLLNHPSYIRETFVVFPVDLPLYQKRLIQRAAGAN